MRYQQLRDPHHPTSLTLVRKGSLCLCTPNMLLVVILAVLSTVTCDESLETTLQIERVEGDHIPQIFGDIFIQLAETAYSLPELRNRRHAHGNKKIKMPGDNLCCDFPNLSSKRDVRACHQEFMSTSNITQASTVEENQQASKCFMECIAKRKGWVNGDGALDLTVVNATLQAGQLSPQWQQLQAEAAEKCFPEITIGRSGKNSNGTCNSGSQRLMYCIFEHTFLNCPSDSWHENEKCRAALSLVNAMSERRVQGGADEPTS